MRKWGQKLSSLSLYATGKPVWMVVARRRSASSDRDHLSGYVLRVTCIRSSKQRRASLQECGLVQSTSTGNNGALALAVRTVQNQGMCYNLGMAGDSAVQDIKEDGRLPLVRSLTLSTNRKAKQTSSMQIDYNTLHSDYRDLCIGTVNPILRRPRSG